MKALKGGNASESEKGIVVFCNHLSSDWVCLRSLWADHSRSQRSPSHADMGARALTGRTIGGFSYGVRTSCAPMAGLASPYDMVSYQEDLLIRCKCHVVREGPSLHLVGRSLHKLEFLNDIGSRSNGYSSKVGTGYPWD